MTLTQSQVREALALAEKATPGPGTVRKDTDRDSEGVVIVIESSDIRVAHVLCEDDPTKIEKADARVIAAARTDYENALRDLEEAMHFRREQHKHLCPFCGPSVIGRLGTCQEKERLRAYYEE